MKYIATVIILSALALGQTLDKYGGRLDTSCTAAASGTRWSFTKVGNRWWWCTPAGHLAFTQGAYSFKYPSNYAAKYGTTTTALQAETAKLKYYGFTSQGPLSILWYPWNQVAQVNKLPIPYYVIPGAKAMIADRVPGEAGTLDQNVKNLFAGRSRYFTNTGSHESPDWLDTTRLKSVLDFMLWQNGGVDPQGIQYAINNNKDLDYVMGILVEDSDTTWGYFTSIANNGGAAAPYNYDVRPAGNGAANPIYLVATMSPWQQVNAVKQSKYDVDPTVYIKKHFADFLANKYSTVQSCASGATGITGLNNCWGSSYTTFYSGATTYTAESIGTTVAGTSTYSHTVTHASLTPNTIKIYSDGTLVAGDCLHVSFSDACNPQGGYDSGAIYSKAGTLSGYVTYSTGAVNVTYVANPQTVAEGSCVSATGTCTYLVNDGGTNSVGLSTTAPNNKATVYLGSNGNVISGTVTTSDTTTYNSGGNEPNCASYSATVSRYIVTGYSGPDVAHMGICWDLPAEKIAKLVDPGNGHVLTMDYDANGWQAGGTGFLDEDGRPTHTWMGTDPYTGSQTSDPYTLHTMNANAKADLKAAYYDAIHTYAAAMRSQIDATLAAKGLPRIMYLGPDSLGSWSSTPLAETMQAFGQSDAADAVEFGGGYQFTSDMMDYIENNFGNKPILMSTFLHSNADAPSTTQNYDPDEPTQEARGQTAYNLISSLLNNTGSSGNHLWAGYNWQNWLDGDCNGTDCTNWGVGSWVHDNLYDAHESVEATVACSAPLNGTPVTFADGTTYTGSYNCGGEPAYPTWSAGMSTSNNNFSVSTRVKQLIGGIPYIFQAQNSGTAGGSAPTWACGTPGTTTVVDGGVTWLCQARATLTNGYGDVMTCSGTSNCGVTAANQLWMSITPGAATDTGIGGGWTIPGGWVIH